MTHRSQTFVLASLLLSYLLLSPCSLGWSESRWAVGRQTNDRDADLIEALIEGERFDEALALCEMLGRGADRQADLAAKSAIRTSEVLVARQMGRETFGESEIQTVSKPVTDLLTAYREHRRKWFLLAHLAAVQRNAALHSLLRAAVSPADDKARDDATRSLLRATVTLVSLSRQIGDARIVLDQQSEDRPLAMIEDLGRLQQKLHVDTVALAVMQTELFRPGSDDRISAATRAEQIADLAITKLPSDTKARREVQRLRVEAILRAGQYDRADQALAPLVVDPVQPLSPRFTALQIRLDMAQQRMPQAATRLADFFGSQPSTAARSIAMDLARLEYLLRTDPGSSAVGSSAVGSSTGDWLEAIQQRGGAYARRRAEAMALSLLGRSSKSTTPMIDPSIVAAQGQDYLRRGEPSRAAELLAAAAHAETNMDRAVTRAAEAAAAFGMADRDAEAIQVLADVALQNPTAEKAAAIHLQAVFLAASSTAADVGYLETLLRKNLQQWPAAETSSSARAWLVKLLVAEKRLVDAAEIATTIPTDIVSSADIDAIAHQWRLAYEQESGSSSLASGRFLTAYQPLLESAIAAERFPLLSALIVDRELLMQVKKLVGSGDPDPFAAALLAFRQHATEQEPIRSPPEDLVADATLRLMRDGRQNAVLRPAIARLLKRWKGNTDGSFGQAERLLWEGSVTQGVKLIRELVRAAPGSAETTSKAARLLEQAGGPEANQEAVRLWDQLAGGAPRGSPLWHDAKLAAMIALRRAGNSSEAQRRARYVLLTAHNMSENHRVRYEEFAK